MQSDSDYQKSKENQYNDFQRILKWSIIACVLCLALMAAFLT